MPIVYPEPSPSSAPALPNWGITARPIPRAATKAIAHFLITLEPSLNLTRYVFKDASMKKSIDIPAQARSKGVASKNELPYRIEIINSEQSAKVSAVVAPTASIASVSLSVRARTVECDVSE